MSSFLIKGAPIVIIPYEIYEKCMGWVESTDDTEVSWRGLGDWDEGVIRITDVFLPIQTASLGGVKAPTAAEKGDIGLWATKCVRDGSYMNEKGDCRYKWHMHSHPGSDWGSLYESSTDEDNTAKFGVKKIEWMIVGRAVPGKFRICLEVFKPYRLIVDYLSVFVEHDGNLHRVSEPGRSPSIEGDFKVELSDINMLGRIKEGDQFFAQVEMIEKITKTPVTYTLNYSGYSSLYESISHGYFDNYDFEDDDPESLLADMETTSVQTIRPKSKAGKKRKSKNTETRTYTRTEIERKAKVLAISKAPVESDVHCTIEKQGGMVFANLEFKVGPWTLRTDNALIDTARTLPINEAIRAEAAKDVKEKVTKIDERKERKTKTSVKERTRGNIPGKRIKALVGAITSDI